MNPDPQFGLGLRPDHYDEILVERPAIDFFEALTENYLVPGGKPLHYLERVRAEYPVFLHGVSLSIGSTAPLDAGYLDDLAALARRIEPTLISDHLCWTGVDGVNLHDLMPLPYTQAALAHLVPRILEVQERLERTLVIENISSYLAYECSEMTEWQFLTRLCEAADCRLLLDINNIYVNSVNHHFDADEFIRGIPANRVAQMHLAGHSHQGSFIIDTHDAPVADSVWALYRRARERLGPIPTMIERDANIPCLEELTGELAIARRPTCEAAA